MTETTEKSWEQTSKFKRPCGLKAVVDINVAIVGCGNAAISHLKAWSRVPYARIVALCDTNKKAVERVAQDWKIPQRFTSIDEMTGLKKITLWDICTPIQTHRYLATRAMKDGFDVLIEKPLAITSDDAKEIVGCQKTTGRMAGVIHNWLFDPPVFKARAIVEGGFIGEVIGAHVNVLHTKNEPMTANKDHWVHQLPGGRFSETMIHPIYLLQRFLGDIKIANLEVAKIGDYQWLPYDELSATVRAGEKLGRIYVSFNASRNSIFVEVFGRKGILKLDIIAATLNVLPGVNMNRPNKVIDPLRQALQLTSSASKNAFKILSRHWPDGHEICIRLFAESIVKGEAPPVTVQEGYEAVRVLEDVYKCIELKQEPD